MMLHMKQKKKKIEIHVHVFIDLKAGLFILQLITGN